MAEQSAELKSDTAVAPDATNEAPGADLEAQGVGTEKRKSNEVEGFKYTYWKMVGMSIFSALTFIPLLPFMPFITSRQTGNPWYRKHYFKTFLFYLKAFPGYITHGTLLRTLNYNFFMTPKAIEERIKLRRGACTRCGKCCSQLNCIFLSKNEEGDNVCTVYGTPFWYYGTCGRYPLTQRDVDDHGCPGFTFLDEEGKLVYDV